MLKRQITRQPSMNNGKKLPQVGIYHSLLNQAQKKGLSLSKLCIEIGVPPSSIRQWATREPGCFAIVKQLQNLIDKA